MLRPVRIIAGEFRGRKLLAPEGDQTRPVTDRVKQSVFDIVSHRLENAVVYDCFAGTGSFGIESLSRGAKHVIFYESHKPTAARLRRNIETVGCQNRATVITADFFQHIRAAPSQPADLIFLDPPYRFLRERNIDLQLAGTSIAKLHLAPAGVVVFRHDAADEFAFDELPVVDRREYGSMTVQLLGRTTASEPVPLE
jgi:16S rRNA (guanine966-N2)-methyltransferase